MIRYQARGMHLFRHICRMDGSVFPKCILVALPSSILTGILCSLSERPAPGAEHTAADWANVVADNAAWNGFTFVVGFLVVFRTSQAYKRFCDGATATHQMRAEWFDACAALVAFCRIASAEKLDLVNDFQNRLIRFFSMLHAMALSEIEDCAHIEESQAIQYELIDVVGLDAVSLQALRVSSAKVELVFNWIQSLVVDSIPNGVLVIPPPILSRSFQELATGMVCFHDAMKISTVPFPFPYAQSCDVLLILHWMIVPFVVTQFVNTVLWGVVFAFIQVFTMWALNFIAVELENPYGHDANDIDGRGMQDEFNQQLLMLVHPDARRVPTLVSDAEDLLSLLEPSEAVLEEMASNPVPKLNKQASRLSFAQAWVNMDRQMMEDKRKMVHTHSQKTGKPSIRRMSLQSTGSNDPASVSVFSVLLGRLPRPNSSQASRPSQPEPGIVASVSSLLSTAPRDDMVGSCEVGPPQGRTSSQLSHAATEDEEVDEEYKLSLSKSCRGDGLHGRSPINIDLLTLPNSARAAATQVAPAVGDKQGFSLS